MPPKVTLIDAYPRVHLAGVDDMHGQAYRRDKLNVVIASIAQTLDLFTFSWRASHDVPPKLEATGRGRRHDGQHTGACQNNGRSETTPKIACSWGPDAGSETWILREDLDAALMPDRQADCFL